MGLSSPIINLKNFFPEISWSQTIPALRQDAAVWAAIQDDDFRRAAMSELGATPEAWTPANLALLSLGYKLRAADLRNVPNSLPADLTDRAQYAFDNLTPDTDYDLTKAGLIALALRDKPDQWGALPQAALINTALACLFSLLPHGAHLLQTISLDQTIHILLSNPLPKESQLELLEQHLKSAPADERLSILNTLQAQRPKIAEELTQRLSTSFQSAAPKSKPTKNAKGVTSRLTPPIKDLQALLQQADFQQLAANPEDARAALSSAQEAVEQIQAGLALQAAQAAVQAGEPKEALALWRESSPHQPADGSAALALMLLEHGYFDEANSLSSTIDDQTPSSTASALLLEARLAAHEGDLPNAQVTAKQALEIYNSEDAPHISENALAMLLLDLNLTSEAISLASSILDQQPNDAKSAQIMARALRQAGTPDQALSWSHLSVTLDPENLDLHRDLANTLESLGEWSDALGERETLIQKEIDYKASDHHALANCALHADQPQRAYEICGGVLERDSQDGMAHTFLGQAISVLWNPDEGLKHFEKAIQLTPDRPEPWLALAQAQQSKGEREKARQTLLTASRAAAESPEIHFALGHAYQKNDAPTKALKAFQRASELNINDSTSLNTDITQALGDTLIALGHMDEANQILGVAHRSRPTHAGLAHAYAKTLLSLKQPEEALAPLYMALRNDPDNQEIQLDYAQAQLATRTQLDQAEESLKDLLRLDPDHALAKALLAETLEINGKDQAALEVYHLALGSELAKDPAWIKHLSLGLSRVALKLDQAETALAALENAWGKNPDNTEIARMLSEVYKANKLPNKALQVAKSAMQANLSDLDMVIWFADQALELDVPNQALSAIDKGLLLDPHRPQLHLKKGHIQLQLEDFPGAGESFDQVSTLEYAAPGDLETAAEGLIAIGDIPRAAASLERAVVLCKSNCGATAEEKDFLIKLLTRLAQTHEANHDYHAALESIDEALAVSTGVSSLEVNKAALLIKLGQIDRATAWIEASLDSSPENPGLNLQAARIHRAQGDLNTAIYHAQKALDGFEHPQKLSAIVLKADLATGMMQPDLADQVLYSQAAVLSTDIDDLIAFHCLKGELALTKNAEIAAADALTAALQVSPEHPRTLALRARLHLRQGNADEAKQVLEKALLALSKFENGRSPSPEIHLAIVETALECQTWDSAMYLLNEAGKIAPFEPLAFAKLARALVLRAEYQHLCRQLNLQAHAVGESASSEHAFGQFEAAILAATRSLDSIRDTILDTNHYQDFLAIWLARGQAVFQPSLEHAKALTDLSPTPANKAAYLAALRASGAWKQAAKTALAIYDAADAAKAADAEQITHPELWGQIALAITREDHDLASQAAQTALDNAIRSAHPNYAIFHALKANVAHRVGDQDAQLEATQALLSVWEDEPYWYTQAADLLINNHERLGESAIQDAIAYLDKAAQLEPLKVSHHQKLGEVHLAAEHIDAAIRSFKRATTLAPEDPQPWLSLAEIFQTNGELRQAEKCAKQALQLSPEIPGPHLILAEIALKHGRPQDTQQHVEKVLQIKPGEPQALLLEADALILMNKHAEALTALETATARILPTTDLLLKTVELKRHVHGEKAALESLNNLAAQHPEEPQILVAQAQALAEAGDTQQAIQAAQRVLQVSGEELSAEDKARLLHTLGLLLGRNGQLDQAVQHLSEAINHMPDWVDPYIELGRTYHKRRQYDLALQTYQQAIAISPGDPRAYHRAGLTLKETKDYPNAEMMLRKAAQLTPVDIGIQRQLAAIVALNLVHNPKNVLTSIRTSS